MGIDGQDYPPTFSILESKRTQDPLGWVNHVEHENNMKSPVF